MSTASSAWALLVTAALGSSLADDLPAPGKQVPASTTVKVKSDEGEQDVTLRYLLYLPPDYNPQGTARWPLVLFLHGGGERGEDIEKVKIHGPPKLAAQGKEFPLVLVSPQSPTDGRWNPQALGKLVDELANTLRIDRQRLYVTGLSFGGSGTWSLVASQASPVKFAAAMPLCGRGDLDTIETLAKTPIWVLVGDKDREQTVQNCREMAEALEKAGGEVKLTVYPDLPHDCWTV